MEKNVCNFKFTSTKYKFNEKKRATSNNDFIHYKVWNQNKTEKYNKNVIIWLYSQHILHYCNDLSNILCWRIFIECAVASWGFAMLNFMNVKTHKRKMRKKKQLRDKWKKIKCMQKEIMAIKCSYHRNYLMQTLFHSQFILFTFPIIILILFYLPFFITIFENNNFHAANI